MGTQNFQMYAGDDKTLQVTVVDEDGDPVNLTAASIKWQATRSLGKTSAISKTATAGGGITITDASNGEFEVTLTAANTDGLSGTYQHEAEVTFVDGTKSTVLSGTMNIIPVVIQAT